MIPRRNFLAWLAALPFVGSVVPKSYSDVQVRDARNSQFLECRQFSIEELTRWYGVPPHIIGAIAINEWRELEVHSNG